MRVIAYSYDADIHCIGCTQGRLANSGFKFPVNDRRDEHLIPENAVDSEGNKIHPIFSTDENSDGLYCGDCHEEIEAPARAPQAPGPNIRCYDNGGKTIDRYTVVYLDHKNERNGFFECVGCNGSPFHPQGIGQHSECQDGPHLGKEIAFADLPADVQKLVRQDLQTKKGQTE